MVLVDGNIGTNRSTPIPVSTPESKCTPIVPAPEIKRTSAPVPTPKSKPLQGVKPRKETKLCYTTSGWYRAPRDVSRLYRKKMPKEYYNPYYPYPYESIPKSYKKWNSGWLPSTPTNPHGELPLVIEYDIYDIYKK